MLLQMALFYSFYGWVISLYTHTHTHLYTYTPHLLYPFIYWLTLRLHPSLGYCKPLAPLLLVEVRIIITIVHSAAHCPPKRKKVIELKPHRGWSVTTASKADMLKVKTTSRFITLTIYSTQEPRNRCIQVSWDLWVINHFEWIIVNWLTDYQHYTFIKGA